MLKTKTGKAESKRQVGQMAQLSPALPVNTHRRRGTTHQCGGPGITGVGGRVMTTGQVGVGSGFQNREKNKNKAGLPQILRTTAFSSV